MNSPLVVLTDFFAVSNRALSYAAELAVPLQAQLVLLHVRHDGLLSPAENGRPAGQEPVHMNRALQDLADRQPVLAEVEVSEQFLPEAVKEAVRRHHPLLLVLGRPGSAMVPAELVTNTAMDLLRHAPYPLLVVPTVGWDTFPPRRLLLAVDGEPFALYEYQDVLREVLRATQGTLDVLHVTTTDADVPTTSAVLATVRENHLIDPLTEGYIIDIGQATVVGGILQEAAEREADLLVVVARRHSLLGGLFHRSVTAQLLQESPIPVLVLPAQD